MTPQHPPDPAGEQVEPPPEAEAAGVSRETAVLLAQYQVVAQHHIHFMGLIWQIPALATAIGGSLVVFSYGRDLPGVIRVFVLGIGAVLLFVMTIALERYRMFQLRRRKDLHDLELDLRKRGARSIVWDGDAIYDEVRRGAFRMKPLPLVRWEGFGALRMMMYVVTLIVSVTCLLALADALNLLPLP